MRIFFFIFLFYLLNVGLIKCDNDDEEDSTIDDNSINTDKKSNVPLIKSFLSNIYFEEQFQDKTTWSRWIKSKAKKDDVDENIAKYDGEWAFEVPQSSVYNDDYGLVLKVIYLNSFGFFYF